jgi:hypothetical protein
MTPGTAPVPTAGAGEALAAIEVLVAWVWYWPSVCVRATSRLTRSRRSSVSGWASRSERSPGPKAVLFGAGLPKTGTGKIMRRLLKDIAEGRALGDTTTLADPAVLQALKQRYAED